MGFGDGHFGLAGCRGGARHQRPIPTGAAEFSVRHYTRPISERVGNREQLVRLIAGTLSQNHLILMARTDDSPTR